MGNALERISMSPMAKEAKLEEILAGDLSILSPSLMLIGRQVPTASTNGSSTAKGTCAADPCRSFGAKSQRDPRDQQERQQRHKLKRKQARAERQQRAQ